MLRNLLFLRSAYMLLFIGVIAVNGAANALPINGLTTGAVSDLYPNLFTPAGFAFSIWGLIYSGLLAFLVRILITSDTQLVSKLFPWFAINSLANMAWIFAWHYL
jgi:benzodiazapine receptor